MGSGELQVWGLPLLSVRFRNGRAADNGSACYSQAESYPTLGIKHVPAIVQLRDFSDFPVHNRLCLWIEVEKQEQTYLSVVNSMSLCPRMVHPDCAKLRRRVYVQEGEFMCRQGFLCKAVLIGWDLAVTVLWKFFWAARQYYPVGTIAAYVVWIAGPLRGLGEFRASLGRKLELPKETYKVVM